MLLDIKETGDDDEFAVSFRCSRTAHYADNNGLDYHLKFHNNSCEER